jgi:4-hydroxy-tetrahydrodipicolinate reductase
VSAIRIVIAGAAGRMGRMLIRTAVEDADCAVSGALEAPGHSGIGADCGTVAGVGPVGTPVSDDAGAAIAGADAVIDFTSPPVSVALARIAAARGVVHVIGTTGFSARDENEIAAAARRTVIVKSGNMSLGVTLLAALVKRAANALPGFDVEILDMHHRMKADAPSGTALLLGRAAAEGRGLEMEAENARAGFTGPRKTGTIGFASLRGGTAVGEHHVILAGPHERVVLGHIAEDRAIFARGAIAAAKWGQSRAPGLYEMADVLGIADGAAHL